MLELKFPFHEKRDTGKRLVSLLFWNLSTNITCRFWTASLYPFKNWPHAFLHSLSLHLSRSLSVACSSQEEEDILFFLLPFIISHSSHLSSLLFPHFFLQFLLICSFCYLFAYCFLHVSLLITKERKKTMTTINGYSETQGYQDNTPVASPVSTSKQPLPTPKSVDTQSVLKRFDGTLNVFPQDIIPVFNLQSKPICLGLVDFGSLGSLFVDMNHRTRVSFVALLFFYNFFMVSTLPFQFSYLQLHIWALNFVDYGVALSRVFFFRNYSVSFCLDLIWCLKLGLQKCRVVTVLMRGRVLFLNVSSGCVCVSQVVYRLLIIGCP